MIASARLTLDAIAAFVLLLGVVSTLFLALLALRRLDLAREARARLAIEEHLRPLALAVLDEELAPSTIDLPPKEAALFAEMLARYGRSVRGSASERLRAWFQQSGAVAAARGRLSSRRSWERAAAAFALGDMVSSESVPDLLAALEDDDATVRAAAARSLGRLETVDAVEPLLEAQAAGRLPRLVAGQALLGIGPPALPRLVPLIGAPDAAERAAAVELVGLIGGAVDEAPVVAALRDTSADVRASAALALGRLGAEEAAAALRGLLEDRIPFVRAAAAEALGAVGDELAAPRLRQLAIEDAFEPARAAARALALIRPADVAGGGSPHLDEAADLLAL